MKLVTDCLTGRSSALGTLPCTPAALPKLTVAGVLTSHSRATCSEHSLLLLPSLSHAHHQQGPDKSNSTGVKYFRGIAAVALYINTLTRQMDLNDWTRSLRQRKVCLTVSASKQSSLARCFMCPRIIHEQRIWNSSNQARRR